MAAKKRRTLDSDELVATPALCVMPLPCIKRVFAYACDVPSTEPSRARTFNLVQHDADLPSPPQLQRFALVCSHWRTLADTILQERRAFSMQCTLHISSSSSSSNSDDTTSDNVTSTVMNAAEVAQELRARAYAVRDLQLAIAVNSDGTSNTSNIISRGGSSSSTLLSDVDTAVIDWSALLQHCSGLWRLDLTGVPLYSTHLEQILDAAGAHCSELQSLVLPDKTPRATATAAASAQLQQTFASLYRALERWHARNGGLLRQLTVPRRCEEPLDAFAAHTDAFLSAIAANCPNLEHLDGWKATYDDAGEFIECEEMLFCHRDAWSRFCACCSQLREVNWFIVPFASEFFATFALHAKPRLTKLTLAGDPPDKWSEALVDGSYYDGERFAFTKADVACVLHACPALEELVVRLYNSENELVTQELFDDAFLLALARACPRLVRFSFDELESGQPISESRVITDAGFEALAHLPDLADVYVKQTSCSGVGVFAFVDAMRRPLRYRSVHLVVGNADRSDFARFYTLLVELLECFDACTDASRFATHRFELRITRQCVVCDSVTQDGGRALVLRFAALVQSLRTRYAHVLQLRVGVNDGWDTPFADRSDEQLDATLGAARAFVLSGGNK